MNDKFNITQLQNELISKIFNVIPPHTRLKKERVKGTIIETTPEIIQGKYDVSKYINYGSFDEIFYRFYQILEENFSHHNLSAFYTNLKSLRVKVRNYNIMDLISIQLFQTLDAGSYNTNKNRLTVIDKASDEISSIICHELLHMASTIETQHTTFVGFHQENKATKKTIGVALNEGYTEYLNKKYFNSTLETTYENEIDIAERIEFIIGKDKMQELYFTANLNGLIDELAKYTTVEKAISIIKDLDKIMKSKEKQEIKEQKYSEIRKNISKIYIEQQKQLLDEGKISEEEFFKRKIMYGSVYIAKNIDIPEGTTFYRDKDKIEIIRPDDIIVIDYRPKSEQDKTKERRN